MLEQVGRFLEMMIVYKLAEAEQWLQKITEWFSREFAFLPLKYGKSRTLRIFTAMRDRSDFVVTIREIKTETLHQKEKNWFAKEIQGQEVDARHYKAPNCGLVLGYGKAAVLPNGIVVHHRCREECTLAGARIFQSENREVKTASTGKVRWGQKEANQDDPKWTTRPPVATLLWSQLKRIHIDLQFSFFFFFCCWRKQHPRSWLYSHSFK
jgi:hypothetical protein